MRPMELIAACQMFLVPASILFGALGMATTQPLKTLISLMGLVTSGVWAYRLWFWSGLSPIDRNTTLALAGVFAIGWLVALLASAVLWFRGGRTTSAGA